MSFDSNEEFAINIGKKIKKLIDTEFDKYGVDSGYFNFKLTCDLLDESGVPNKTVILIEPCGYKCGFCGVMTYYYLKENAMYVCAECFGKCKGKIYDNK